MADTLLVRFPPAGDRRWQLKEFCEQEGPGHVPPGDFVMEILRRQIMLWWD